MLQTIQGPFAGHNGDHCQPDDLKVYKKGVFLNVEQAQTALPGLMTWLYLWIMSASNSPCSLMFFLSTSLAGQWLDGRPKRLWTFRSNRPRHKMAAGPPEKFLLRDNGAQYVSDSHSQLLEAHEIVSRHIPACTPQYNGSVECGGKELKNVFYNVWEPRQTNGSDKEKTVHQRVQQAMAETVHLLNFQIPRPAPGGVTPADVQLGLQIQQQREIAEYREQQAAKKCLPPFHDHFGM
jgi:hypothetical protein